MPNEIYVKGARANNLKNIDLKIPRDKMIVFTGLSGSGKSSLAFDTIYAEGQRRYVESLSSYARQFLGQMEKPDVEFIEGLSPAISIDQKTTSKNPRSTVGTVTEIHDYLRLLYARIGVPHCHICGREISSQSVDQIVDILMENEEGTKLIIMAPVVRQRKGQHEKILDRIRREGFPRVRVDGELYLVNEEEIKLEKNNKHTIEIVIDRIVIKDGQQGRISEAVELAIKEGDGLILAQLGTGDDSVEKIFSTKLACPEHGVSIEELEPRMFSFNNPFGACPVCNGIGFTETVDPKLIIKEDESIADGALSQIFATMQFTGHYWNVIDALADIHKVDLKTPYKNLPKKFCDELLYGTGEKRLKYEVTSSRGKVQKRDHTFEGLIPNLERRYRETNSDLMKEWLSKFMTVKSCDACHGKRLRPEILAVRVGGKNIAELSDLPVRDALSFVENLELSEKETMIARQIVKEIKERLSFLVNVGLDYLTLSRSAGTLSGGESQRIRLATQIGSSLVGVLYILDEPSIGLHQRDNDKLLATLRHLTDIGNTLIVVEHDEDTMYAADQIVDIGPGAGINGGEVVAQGTVQEIKENKNSLTGQYLSGARKIEVPKERRSGNGKLISIKGARANNLKNIDVDIPLGKFVCVTGVSGSGKSSLINEILNKGASAIINRTHTVAGEHDEILGLKNIDKVIDIDQSPIGRTPRSNPATYTGMFTKIRDLFAALPEAKMRGFGKGRFSFNVKGGRCEACNGDGIIKIEMHFLPDVYVPCEVCGGKRYNRETLEVKYKGKSIFDVLDMSVDEGVDFFKNIPSIKRHLQTLQDVGLGYIKIGQPSTQLSGGEAQRIKLATELSKRSTGNTLYILDEPTTGLHFADVDKLISVLQKLVDAGNSIVIIEHNLEVIKCADHIVDLGPEGGDKGGNIVSCGTPEEIAENKNSYTGQYLKPLLYK
ncbi:MAG: excinuclease ABC subunit UvrA [Eubacterium sp.]|nr:excinuclease ABC subunit UvrA [Eubacterium sp.]